MVLHVLMNIYNFLNPKETYWNIPVKQYLYMSDVNHCYETYNCLSTINRTKLIKK